MRPFFSPEMIRIDFGSLEPTQTTPKPAGALWESLGFQAASLHIPVTSPPFWIRDPWRRGTEFRTLLQVHGVLTTTPSRLRTAVIRMSLEVGQRVKPETAEAEGQVSGLGEKGQAAMGQKYVFHFPWVPPAQLFVHSEFS